MKKKLMIIAHFTDVGENFYNGRFSYIASHLSDEYDITLITSDFSHIKKNIKDKTDEILSYNVIYVHEPPYKKNISIKRVFCHRKFGKNVTKRLSSLPCPDLIYCAVPSLGVGKAATDYCREKKIPLIIDIQDLWPEAFHYAFRVPVIGRLIFSPMYKTADHIYSNANQIVAVSETFVNRALEINPGISKGYCVYLGTCLESFDKIAQRAKINKHDKEIRIAYIGTLGHSYNIEIILEAIEKLKKKSNRNVKFIIMGDGPLKDKLEISAREKNIDVVFTGRLPYDKMVEKLVDSHIAVNPINKGASQIINKVGDYAAAGLPVINTQENGEYWKAVESRKLGINCRNDDVESVADALNLLLNDEKIRIRMGENNRRFAEEKFDRGRTYTKIFSLISEYIRGNQVSSKEEGPISLEDRAD